MFACFGKMSLMPINNAFQSLEIGKHITADEGSPRE